METVLLIIADRNLRQLYHELLLSKNIEVIPCPTIENAIGMLTVLSIETVVIFADDTNNREIEVFLQLRQTYHKWQVVSIILLTLDDVLSDSYTYDTTVVTIERLTPEDIANKIKAILNQ